MVNENNESIYSIDKDNIDGEFFKCRSCKRPTLGHNGPCDEDCEYVDEVDDETSKTIEDLIKARTDFKDSCTYSLEMYKSRILRTCDECGKVCKNECGLNVHKLIHNGGESSKKGNKSKSSMEDFIKLEMEERRKER